MLEELRPKVEVAVKSGALPLVLGGDDSIVLATIAGCRRYYRNVGLIYFDRDAGLNEPATTPSGCVDGMVISHVIGRGAPELVRFWGEPPLVREPEIALLGIDRLDEPEQQYLSHSLLRRYPANEISRRGRGGDRRGSARARARTAERIRAAHRSGRDCQRRFCGDEPLGARRDALAGAAGRRWRCWRDSRSWPPWSSRPTTRRSMPRAQLRGVSLIC